MSGGSYDYLSSQSPTDQVGLIVAQADSLLEDFDHFVSKGEARNEEWEKDRRQPHTRPINELEQIACAATRAKLASFIERAKALVDEVSQFKDLLHSIEWTASGDTGPADVVHTCVEFVETKLGVKLTKANP